MAEHNRLGLDWEDIRVFIALARHLNLSSAARALSVNHATVSRRMQSLEATLGEKLVERRPGGYILTPAGNRALIAATDMAASAAMLRRGSDDERPKGLVRINAPPSLTHGFLIEQLAKLVSAHSGLDIDLATDFRNVSLERRETDIALRFERPEDGDVIARPLVTINFGFYATAQVCREIDSGAAPVFICFDEANAYLPEARWLSGHFPHARFSFRTISQIGQAVAAKQHAGIALLPHFIGRKEQELQRCNLEYDPPPRALWLITRGHDRKDIAIKTVADFLTKVFSDERQLFD